LKPELAEVLCSQQVKVYVFENILHLVCINCVLHVAMNILLEACCCILMCCTSHSSDMERNI
jgi:hypothetical protein